MILDCSLRVPCAYLWIPERSSPLGQAIAEYNGKAPVRVWSLPQFTDPDKIPDIKGLPGMGIDATMEFPGIDYLYIQNQGKFYYNSRFHQGNHWLRLEF